MKTWIALFRGINVGGNNLLPMKSLPPLLRKLNCENARTYIQSGNVAFRSARSDAKRIAASIGAAIGKAHEFQPRVFVLSLQELEKIIAENPFPHAVTDPKSLHLFFLSAPVNKPDRIGLDAIKTASESYVLTSKAFYLHTPMGVGKSKLAERVERLLGVDVTARNWRTVTKVRELADALVSPRSRSL